MALSPGMRVRDTNNPGRLGMITSATPRLRPSGSQWQVRWDTSEVSFEYEQNLEAVAPDSYRDPYDLVREGKYGRMDDFRRHLTFVHLTGRLANLVYSMGVTNTEFYPHQYRPLLTLLESPGTGILIADEVGLGKTIEAGLIWTEYRARYDQRRLLVVCPAMLREKWRDELELRFGVHAQIVGPQELLGALQKHPAGSGPEAAWIISYQSARPPRAWTAEPRDTHEARAASAELADFLHARSHEHTVLDMVIFDEAHHMRNRETGAWRLGELLREVSDYQLMLSATPINLRTEDLFNLLTLLDPDHFSRLDDLEQLIQSNRPLVAARDCALNMTRSAAQYRAALEEVRRDRFMSGSAQLQRLVDNVPTETEFESRQRRAELADALERMSLLSHVLTRTRKRDVQERRIARQVFREPVPMSSVERQLYDAVTSATRQYAVSRNVSDGFLLAMPQRQVSSSPAALLRMWQEGAPEDELERDSIDEPDAEEPGRSGFGPLRTYLQSTIPRQIKLAELEKHDTKLQRLVDLLRDLFGKERSEKVILFTTFRATARYVAERLNAAGVPATIVWGRPDTPKHVVIQEFQNDPAQRVLVSTEVAAEGVDLQFCRTVINYDLPWNPTRVEQRIGRIDRLGQCADRIFVWNLYFADTIDDRIVTRLLARLRVFEEALGETEAVVGEAVARLEYELLCRPWTPEEESALIDRAALALEYVARQRKELEENAPHMMAHGQRVLERIAAAQQLSRYVTERDLFTFVRDCLARYWPGHEFTADDEDPMRVELRLPAELLLQWEPYLRERGALGHTRLTTGRRTVVFRNNVAEHNRPEREVIHQFHPLVGFLAADLKRREEQFFPVIALRLHRQVAPASVGSGCYVYCLYQWSFAGVQQEEWLISAVAPETGGAVLAEETAEMLVQVARVEGRDWLGADQEVDGAVIARALELAEASIEERFTQAVARKRAENADRARFQSDSVERHEARRLQTLSRVEERLRERGRDSLVKATQGQRRVFLERMQNRRAAIQARSEVMPSKRFICGGIIRVDA